MSRRWTEITDKASLDELTEHCKSQPSFLFITNSSLPVHKTFQLIFEDVANDSSNEDIHFCLMDYSDTTSPLMKFAPNQLPVLIVMHGESWCRTVMGADRKRMQALLQELKAAYKQ
jgi:hypothetical protein